MINTNKIETTERPECSADTKLFFDGVYTNSKQTKKAQVETVQYGRSMIEMLGVLAIVGVLSVGGIAGYSKAMEKFKINKTANQITQIITNIRTLYAQQTNFLGLNETLAVQMGIIPDEMGTASSLTNAFGGTVTIETSWNPLSPTFDTGLNTAYEIVYNGLPKEACITLSTLDWGNTSSTGLLAYRISESSMGRNALVSDYTTDKSASEGYVRYGSKYLPLPVSIAATACSCEENTCSIGMKLQK